MQVIYSEFIFKLCYVKFVFNIYLQPYQNIFLPIKNMRNNLKFYANMRLLKYRLFFINLKYTLQNTTDFIINLKDKIQQFMLCLKGKIHRKVLFTLKFKI